MAGDPSRQYGHTNGTFEHGEAFDDDMVAAYENAVALGQLTLPPYLMVH
jgi:hypothetical protein